VISLVISPDRISRKLTGIGIMSPYLAAKFSPPKINWLLMKDFADRIRLGLL
jgi:hypothetical protein